MISVTLVHCSGAGLSKKLIVTLDKRARWSMVNVEARVPGIKTFLGIVDYAELMASIDLVWGGDGKF